MSNAKIAYIGQATQAYGRAAQAAVRGDWVAVVNHLHGYLTRADLPEDLRNRIMELYLTAVDHITPRRYTYEVRIRRTQRTNYIPVPAWTGIKYGDTVRVTIEKIEEGKE